jgi:hypothetical protein
MFVTLLLPSRMRINKYVIWSLFENNFVYVMHCISKFDRATLFRHVSDHVFVFLRSMIQAAIFWTNSMMQQAFLPDFPHGRSPQRRRFFLKLWAWSAAALHTPSFNKSQTGNMTRVLVGRWILQLHPRSHTFTYLCKVSNRQDGNCRPPVSKPSCTEHLAKRHGSVT